jgi:hypothetical protein
MLASMAGFRRRIESINFDERAPVPLGFVCQLTDELTPSYVTDSLRQRMVFHHVLDCQTLHADHLVFMGDACAELVLVVASSISDASMNFGDFQPGLVPILGAFFLLGKSPLGFCQPLLILGKVARIADAFTGGKGNHRRNTQVKPDHLLYHGKWLDIIRDQDGDKVAVGTILDDRDRTGLAPFGQRTMPDNLQRRIHLRQREDLSIPREGIGSGGYRLLMTLCLEGGIRCSAFKAVDKGAVQMPQGLLQGNRRSITQPGILLFERRQHGCKIVVGQALALLEIGRLARRKAPVVDEAATSERPSKDLLLLIGGIEAVLVGSLLHLLAFLLLKILFDDGERRASNCRNEVAIGPKGGKFTFQDRKLLAQEPTASAFDEAYQAVNTQRGVTLDQQMHMIRHHFQAQDFCLVFLTDFSNDLGEPLHYSLHQHLAPIFGTPDDVVFAGIEHVPIGLISYLAHRDSMQHKAIYCQ